LIRSFVEIDILNPYQVGSFLLYFIAGKLTMKAQAPRRVPLASDDRSEFEAPVNWEPQIGR
jgi:exopolysaccharide production protein ExoQ